MQLSETGEKYPYFIVPDVERYKTLDPDSEEAKKLRLRISVNIGDKEVLKNIFGDENVVEDVKPEGAIEIVSEIDAPQSAEDSSFGIIDSFLDNYKGEIAPIGYIPEEPTSPASEKNAENIDNQNISELKKLIRDHKYQEAIELIEAQNLNNPQKSIYFAHQMRFLKKLIAIEKYKNPTEG